MSENNVPTLEIVSKPSLKERFKKWLPWIRAANKTHPRIALESLIEPEKLADVEPEAIEPVDEQIKSEPIEHVDAYHELREKSGLKLYKSKEERVNERHIQREAAVSAYLENHRRSLESSRDEDLSYDEFIERGKQRSQEEFNNLPILKQFEMKIRRRNAISSLKAKGVENAEEVIQLCEATFDYDSRAHIRNPVDRFGSMFWTIYKSNDENFAALCKDVGNVHLAYERAYALGVRSSFRDISADSSMLKLQINGLRELSLMSQNQFDYWVNELQQYGELFQLNESQQKNYDAVNTLRNVIDFISTHEKLSQDERKAFRNELLFSHLLGFDGDDGYKHELNPNSILLSADYVADAVLVMQECLTVNENVDIRQILKSFGAVLQSEDRKRIVTLLQYGFQFDETYVHELLESGLPYDKVKAGRESQLIEFLSDENSYDKLSLVHDYFEKQGGTKTFSISEIDMLRPIFDGSEKVNNFNAVEIGLKIVNGLGGSEQKKLAFLRELIKPTAFDVFTDVDGVVGAHLYQENSLLPEQQAAWKCVQEWVKDPSMSAMKNHGDLIGLFFTYHQDTIADYIHENRLTDQFFTDFTEFYMQVSDDYYQFRNVDNKDVYAHRYVNQFLLSPDRAPPCVADFSQTIVDRFGFKAATLDGLYENLSTSYIEWQNFVDNHKFTLDFVSYMLSHDQARSGRKKILLLLTEEMCQGLSGDERKFWKTLKDFGLVSEDLGLFIHDHRNDLDRYVVNGHATSALLREYVVGGSSDDNYSRKQKDYDAIAASHLLMDIPDKEKGYWLGWSKLSKEGKEVFTRLYAGTEQIEITDELHKRMVKLEPYLELSSQVKGKRVIADNIDEFEALIDRDQIMPVQPEELADFYYKHGDWESCDSVILSGYWNTLESFETADLVVGQDNWKQLLYAYLYMQGETHTFLQCLPENAQQKVNALFLESPTKNYVLGELHKQWRIYLDHPNEVMPFDLKFFSKLVDHYEGAGPLSQLEAFTKFVYQYNESLAKSTTIERTKTELAAGLQLMESRFVKDRWSNEDKTSYYNVSTDILYAAPSLYSDFLSLFQTLSPNDLKRFIKELYPLYRARLAMAETREVDGLRKHERKQLMSLRMNLRELTQQQLAGSLPFEVQRATILAEIQQAFKDKFGIIKTPNDFSADHIRSFSNVSMYFANMAQRDELKETTLGFYLSLMLNDTWDNFRKGDVINPEDYLIPEKAAVIKALLASRQELSPIKGDILDIPEAEIPQFLSLLQQETQELAMGDVETIDIKLMNIIRNLDSLVDPDIYPDQLDKSRLQILLDYGNKQVGSVAARMYQKMQYPEREIVFSDEDMKIKTRIEQVLESNKISISAESIKQNFQDGIKPLATIVNMLTYIDESHAEVDISQLRASLEPSREVISIFNRLGEPFKPSSGALAVAQDLNYLDNLINKREAQLSAEEKKLLQEYVATIRGQLIKVQETYDQIKDKFMSIKQSNIQSNNQQFRQRIGEIDTIITAQASQQPIFSTSTNNFNTIMENMRECLSCKNQGCNNDTDLTFGDTKFYLYSQVEGKKEGSIADEILFVDPITYADGSKQMSLILDKVYGTNTPSILTNHVRAVIKKYKLLKESYPQANISIFVTDAACSSVGMSKDMLIKRLSEDDSTITITEASVDVDIARSAFADHYIEFGDISARQAGVRKASGIIIH